MLQQQPVQHMHLLMVDALSQITPMSRRTCVRMNSPSLSNACTALSSASGERSYPKPPGIRPSSLLFPLLAPFRSLSLLVRALALALIIMRNPAGRVVGPDCEADV
ncbi:hypothetical protein Agabi119p4_2506 [Agaricus bisporus var. burnettii]|uniref:Uncharacterized protein n=1 Tax=Agaricus bisporus var. burnettii TaxID=192524 RepID=A0A8H7F9F7_AGABI|nr:hypothetical protein Agabi119p4_2506 [Agaricus bisporus var. burnettii]